MNLYQITTEAFAMYNLKTYTDIKNLGEVIKKKKIYVTGKEDDFTKNRKLIPTNLVDSPIFSPKIENNEVEKITIISYCFKVNILNHVKNHMDLMQKLVNQRISKLNHMKNSLEENKKKMEEYDYESL